MKRVCINHFFYQLGTHNVVHVPEEDETLQIGDEVVVGVTSFTVISDLGRRVFEFSREGRLLSGEEIDPVFQSCRYHRRKILIGRGYV